MVALLRFCFLSSLLEIEGGFRACVLHCKVSMSPAFSRKGSGCCHDLLDVFVPVGGGGDLLVLSTEFGGFEEDCDEPPQGNDPILIRRPASHLWATRLISGSCVPLKTAPVSRSRSW